MQRYKISFTILVDEETVNDFDKDVYSSILQDELDPEIAELVDGSGYVMGNMKVEAVRSTFNLFKNGR